MERTLVILKPGAIQRGIAGEVISRFEKRGLRIIAMKMAQLTPEICKVHYAHLLERPFYPWIEASMTASPVILMCVEGVDAVHVVHEMAGATNGRKAAPGTIRGDYCLSAQENVVHTSDTVENAAAELARFFKDEDYCEYSTPMNAYLYAPDEV